MPRARTTAQALRDNPQFAAMSADVTRLRKAWPGTHVVAHLNEPTGEVTFHLHVMPGDLDRLQQLLGDVQINQIQDMSVTTYHFHGRRQHMDTLLRQVTR